MPDATRYAILDHASGEAALWEITQGLTDIRDGERKETHRAFALADVRPVLVELLREGHVELYDLLDPRGPMLTLDEALVVVADETNWSPSTATRQTHLVLTEAGTDELRREIAAAGPAGNV